MKILCLHGHGTSGAIFKSQTAAFRSKLDATYEFDFVDAPYPSAPAPGIEVLYKTGHYTWWPNGGVPAIRETHKWLLDYTAAHGPYDAVCCFSQGCSLASSFLLYHARERPEAPLPFRAALFICGGVPLPVLADLGVDVPPRAYELSDETGRLLHERAGALATLAADLNKIQQGVGLWDDTTGLLHDTRPGAPPAPDHDVFGIDFTRVPADLRIRIPTAHVLGRLDPRWPAGEQLARLCEGAKLLDHGGGHDIPRTTEVSNQIAELVQWLEAQSAL